MISRKFNALMVICWISLHLCTPVQWKELRWSRLKSAKQKVMKKDKAGSCCTHTGHPADVLQDRKFYYPLRLSLGGNFSTQDHISTFASSLSKQKGQELMTLCLFSSFPNCIFVSSSHHVTYCWQCNFSTKLVNFGLSGIIDKRGDNAIETKTFSSFIA